MLRSFLRSTAPIALLLVLGICTSPAIFLLPASTTMISEGVTTTTGPDARTLILSIGLVLALECVNGALEYALDRLHPAHHPEIGRAKDAAAGAVLLASLASAAMGGLMIFAAWRG